MKVKFKDLRVLDARHRQRLLHAIEDVLKHGQLLLGPEVDLFEKKIADYCGVEYCVGLASGTDALLLALQSLNIGKGDEIITTPLSWISTLHAIHFVGATPVFVDIGEDFNISVALIEDKISSKTKAILPVHFKGRICKMEAINKIAKKYSLYVIEDAAQSFGSSYLGKKAGSFGDIGVFSMNPMKVLAACGEAGAIVTNNKEIYDKIMHLRYLGTVDREICTMHSLNAKIDTIQAAILMENINHLDEIIQDRIKIAKFYNDNLSDIVTCPEINDSPQNRIALFDYAILAQDRDRLKSFLEDNGIEAKIKHAILMPDQPAYSHLSKSDLPVARRIVSQILSLPFYEKLDQVDFAYVAKKIRAFYETKN